MVDLDEGRTEEDDEVLCLHDYALRKMKRRMRRLTMKSFVSLKDSVCCLCMYQHSHRVLKIQSLRKASLLLYFCNCGSPDWGEGTFADSCHCLGRLFCPGQGGPKPHKQRSKTGNGEGSEEQLQEEGKNIMSKYSSLNLIVFPCMVLSEITPITSFEVLLCFLSLANTMTQDADFV